MMHEHFVYKDMLSFLDNRKQGLRPLCYQKLNYISVYLFVRLRF